MNEKLKLYKSEFERELKTYLESVRCEEPLYSALLYSVHNGGKRIRPILTRLGAEFMGGEAQSVKEFMIAIELIHSYSLVHDDLPCMDDDTLRRGMPTTHVRFGEGMAVLTGDALLNLAYECILQKADFSADDLRALRLIAGYAGIYGMVNGQCMDIRAENKFAGAGEIEALYMYKTSCLMMAALASGAAALGAGEEEIKDLTLYAKNLGLIFQIVDDILDVTSSEDVLGKNINSDLRMDKTTYIRFSGIEEAKARIGVLEDEARAVLKKYGSRANALIKMLQELTRRKF